MRCPLRPPLGPGLLAGLTALALVFVTGLAWSRPPRPAGGPPAATPPTAAPPATANAGARHPRSVKLSAQARLGRAAMVRAECTRCHAVTAPDGVAPPTLPQSPESLEAALAAAAHARKSDTAGLAPMEQARNCVGCHVWVLSTEGHPAAIEAARADFPDWDRYLNNIKHFRRLPNLGALLRRVRPSFVRAYLDAPFDLRPHLDEAMIPVRLTAAEKDAVVAYLGELAGAEAVVEPVGVEPVGMEPVGVEGAPGPSPARLAEGQAAFGRLGCAVCHLTGNVQHLPGLTAAFYRANPAASLAPNLRFVRDRIPRAVLVRFVQDPAAVDPHTAMPKLAVSPAEAELLADYLLHADFAVPLAPPAVAPTVALLDRPVPWAEVHREVFGFICVHCHMHPDSNAGDGGPGNTGGLGFAGARLDLETWAGVRRGLVRGGKRTDILKPEQPGEPPLLVAALLRRHAEAGRDRVVPFADHARAPEPTDRDRPGMPLGLPPLTLEQVALVATWVAQGAPGPAAP